MLHWFGTTYRMKDLTPRPDLGTTWVNGVLARHFAGMLAARGVSREWYLKSLHKRGSILPPASLSSCSSSALAPAVEEEEDGDDSRLEEEGARTTSGGNIRR